MKQELLRSAEALKQPRPDHANEFRAKSERMAAMGTERLEARPDREQLTGRNNLAAAADNNRNFARFMGSMFAGYNPEVLVETVLWVFRAYRSRGFPTTYWAANLNIWADMLKQELSPETYDAVYPFYNWLIVNIPLFSRLTDEMGDTATQPASQEVGHSHD